MTEDTYSAYLRGFIEARATRGFDNPQTHAKTTEDLAAFAVGIQDGRADGGTLKERGALEFKLAEMLKPRDAPPVV